MTYESTNRPGLPEPVMAHEMWSREVCDRLDVLISVNEEIRGLLQAHLDKPVVVELMEPAPVAVADVAPPVKRGPGRPPGRPPAPPK